jgi:hypothetical protein
VSDALAIIFRIESISTSDMRRYQRERKRQRDGERMREREREQRGREREKEREWQSRPCSVIILPREEPGRSLAALAVSAAESFFFFFITLDTGPRRHLSLALSDTHVYWP